MAEQPFDVLIIGAGLSGLMAAHKLTGHGLSVCLVDKEHTVGGRLATVHVGEGLADYGAQFFTIRSNDFQRAVDEWLVEDIVYVWSNGFSDGNHSTEQFDGYPRYATKGGMNALAHYLAAQLDSKGTIQTDVKISSIAQAAKGWRIQDDKGGFITANAVLITPPVPQSLALLGTVYEQLTSQDREALERISYAPCFAGLFRVEGGVNLPEPGVLQRPEANLSWIADNHRKGISPYEQVITVHASGSFSQKLWDLPDADVLNHIQHMFEDYLAAGATIVEATLKRWPYSQPTVLHSERFLMAHGLPPLVFAGDAFGEARVEGAFLSGSTAGEALAERLTA